MNPPAFERPALDEAIESWKKILAARSFPTEIVWLFEENICFEKSKSPQGGLQIGFQMQFTPPPDDALDIAYDYFAETDARIIFYRVGNSGGKSLCVLLCDPWFEAKSESFLHDDEWRISFHAGLDDEIEEITDLSRWQRRYKRHRAFHDLDFCMSLATIDEIRNYGRALEPYERFAGTMVNRLKRFLGKS
jgi:hypothetical protein